MLIEWVDSAGASSRWRYFENEETFPAICRSVGWLVCDGKHAKKIVPHIARSNEDAAQGNGEMIIPTRSVLRIVPLRSVPMEAVTFSFSYRVPASKQKRQRKSHQR